MKWSQLLIFQLVGLFGILFSPLSVLAICEQGAIYGIGNGNGAIVSIDLSTGVGSHVGDADGGTNAMARDPETGFIYYVETGTTILKRWNPETNRSEAVSSGAIGPYGRMAFDGDGRLFGSQSALNELDKTNGEVIRQISLSVINGGPVISSGGDIAFSPTGELYLIGQLFDLFRVDIDAATASFVGTLFSTDLNVSIPSLVVLGASVGMAFDSDGALYVSNNLADGPSPFFGFVWRVDPSNGNATFLADPFTTNIGPRSLNDMSGNLLFNSDDCDGDGLTNGEEISLGTDPNNPDSDDGGISDGLEVNELDTDPLDPSDDQCGDFNNLDSDADGVSDCEEELLGLDPNNPNDAQVQGSGTNFFGLCSIGVNSKAWTKRRVLSMLGLVLVLGLIFVGFRWQTSSLE